MEPFEWEWAGNVPIEPGHFILDQFSRNKALFSDHRNNLLHLLILSCKNSVVVAVGAILLWGSRHFVIT
jgi:hypothetical protein